MFYTSGRSPGSHPINRQQPYRNSENSPINGRTPNPNKDNVTDVTLIAGRDAPSTPRGDFDKRDNGQSVDIAGTEYSKLNVACPPGCPKAASNAVQNESPPSGPSQGPKSLSSQNRGLNISLLSAPTRPRGGPSFKEGIWGPTARRGPSSASSNIPPSGPRSHLPLGPSTEFHRHAAYRQNSVTTPSYPRTPKYTSYFAGLSSIVPGGKLLSSSMDISVEKRLSQLDADKDRLFEQIADIQTYKRTGVRDWDKFDRESSICALKSELAEGHLQSITECENVHANAVF
ncbi:hypothetical protein EYZ11_006137 [Aspergillus tanneri]|nr:hypothetical protein EYZ11_006137 [Aspergillus tanneri]